MKCTVCSKPITKRIDGKLRCEKHSRLQQMRWSAKWSEKYVPGYEELESMIPADMSCPDCGKVMLWKSKKERHRVATLQHYRDGLLAIVCLSCNSRHAPMPGDSYREMPKDLKYCPSCKQWKFRDQDFYPDRSSKGPLKTKSYCKTCCNEKHASWRTENREKYKEYQRQYQKEWKKRNRVKLNERKRQYYARRKAAGA